MTALIVIAVIVVVIALILSLSATVTVVYDNKWRTTISVLWINKDIELSKILSFILFPQESAKKVKEKTKKKSNKKAEDKIKSEKSENPAQKTAPKSETVSEGATATEAKKAEQPSSDKGSKDKKADKPAEQKKPNYIKNIWDKDGIVGIMLFVSNMVESASELSQLFLGASIFIRSMLKYLWAAAMRILSPALTVKSVNIITP